MTTTDNNEFALSVMCNFSAGSAIQFTYVNFVSDGQYSIYSFQLNLNCHYYFFNPLLLNVQVANTSWITQYEANITLNIYGSFASAVSRRHIPIMIYL